MTAGRWRPRGERLGGGDRGQRVHLRAAGWRRGELLGPEQQRGAGSRQHQHRDEPVRRQLGRWPCAAGVPDTLARMAGAGVGAWGGGAR